MSIYKGQVPVAGLNKNIKESGWSIFDTKWSDHILNDIQWLRSDTFSWQNGNVYQTAYNKLVEEYATGAEETEGSITFKRTSNGFKIATANQETAILEKYNTEGIAWYYILDTTNKRFKLPRTKFGFEGLRTNVGDDIGESLPAPDLEFIYRKDSSSSGVYADIYGHNGATATGLTNTDGTDEYMQSATTQTKTTTPFDILLHNTTYQNSAPVQERATQMYLYFYVGEYSQTAVQQTAGLNSELFNGKLDISTYNSDKKYTTQNITGTSTTVPAVYLKECYIDPDTPTNGYRIWSDGFCEQWGRVKCSTSGAGTVGVQFMLTMKDTKYSVTGTYLASSDNMYGQCYNLTTTGMTMKGYGGVSNAWTIKGYLAEGQY